MKEMSPISVASALLLSMLCLIGWQINESYHHLLSLQKSALSHIPITTPEKVELPVFNSQALVAANLFGITSAKNTVEKAPKPLELRLQELPETTLQLRLKGAFRGREQPESYALISANNAREKAYAVHDSVAEGVLLHAIYAERVVLQRGGKLEVLSFKLNHSGKLSANTLAGAATADAVEQPIENSYYDTTDDTTMDAPQTVEDSPIDVSAEEIMAGLGVSDPDVIAEAMAIDGLPELTGTGMDVQIVRDRLELLQQMKANGQ
jgi:type II secretory pathway component PulC